MMNEEQRMSEDGTVLFVTCGGRSAGFGHVRRCLSLAEALLRRSVVSEFLVAGEAAVAGIVSGAGFTCRRASGEAVTLVEAVNCVRELSPSVIVADSYDFTADFFRELGEAGPAVVAIDDLARGSLPVALVVNATVGITAGDYPRPSGPGPRFLLGPAYALLRPGFALELSRTFHGRVSRVLLTLGGSDPGSLMPKLIRWVGTELESASLGVVAGPLFDNLADVRVEARAIGSRVTVHERPQDMRGLMLDADIAVSGGGQTLYELAATATPTVAVRLAGNQARNLSGFEKAGALTCAGASDDAGLEAAVRERVGWLADNPQERSRMAAAGRALVDGRGAERVAAVLAELAGKELR
jgi:UDP-2,4-diacetamido-2,4,6-trideoxy-beta-L-altropyranose hydrolase